MAFHIWMKANEISLETNMVNINEETHMFDGLTFHEKVLNMKDDMATRFSATSIEIGVMILVRKSGLFQLNLIQHRLDKRY
jgi:hypothetical protein